MNYKLSILMPGHRVHIWEQIYNSIPASVGKHSWELIFVGPNEPPPFFANKKNFKFLKDYGSPARCGQMATTLAEGELMMWGSDDGYFHPEAIAKCVEKHDSIGYKDAVALRYSEGLPTGGTESSKNYFFANYHKGVLDVVPLEYKILCIGMLKTKYFRELGGWDCRFEQLNLNTHDFSFRIQRDGGNIYVSETCVSAHTYNPGTGDHIPVQNAFNDDHTLFKSIYHNKNSAYLDREINIDYFNWINSPKIWKRRFGDM
jgi:hypothetical protein